MNKYIATAFLWTKLNKKSRAKFLRKYKIFHFMGENCGYQPRKLPSEPYLISIHNNVSIAANVTFVTHDITCDVFNGSKVFNYCGKHRFFMGTIEIFDNVFIGTNVTILPNIKIGPNAIVAAGSIVTKDVPKNSIVGGNPARVIGNIFELERKRAQITKNMPDNHASRKEIDLYFWR